MKKIVVLIVLILLIAKSYCQELKVFAYSLRQPRKIVAPDSARQLKYSLTNLGANNLLQAASAVSQIEPGSDSLNINQYVNQLSPQDSILPLRKMGMIKQARRLLRPSSLTIERNSIDLLSHEAFRTIGRHMEALNNDSSLSHSRIERMMPLDSVKLIRRLDRFGQMSALVAKEHRSHAMVPLPGSSFDSIGILASRDIPDFVAVDLPSEMAKDLAVHLDKIDIIPFTGALNHFKGKDSVLIAAMEMLAVYKSRFENLSIVDGIRQIPKARLDLKKLRVGTGIFCADIYRPTLSVDAHYVFLPGLRAGLQWIESVGKQKNISGRSTLNGPGVFADVSLGKSIGLRVECNLVKPICTSPVVPTVVDNLHNRSKVRPFVGLIQRYPLIKNVRGSVTVLCPAMNPFKDAFDSKMLVSRIALDWPLFSKLARTAR